MNERRSLFEKFPDHTVEFEPNPRAVRVELAGEPVAESTRSIFVNEADYPAVVYIPEDDVRGDLIEATNHHTFCPFKGEASYWTLRVGDIVEENVLWSYPEPFEEVAWLEGLMAFYTDRVELKIADD